MNRELGDRHGEGQILANLGLLYVKQGKTKQAIGRWQGALTKLHPDSPDTQKVRGWLQKAQNPFSRFRWLIRFLLLGIAGYFLVSQILAGRWAIVLVMLGVGITIFVLLQVWQRRNQS